MPPAVALLNYISCSILWRIFCQTGTFRGVFSTYHWYRRIHLHTVIFCVFFYLMFAGKIREAAMWGAGVPECMPHRRNWSPPPPHPDVSVFPPWIQRGEPHSFAVEGVGGPNADDWIEGLALCVLSGLGSRVERKRPFTQAARVKRRKTSEAAMGGGRAAPCLARQWAQKDGCAQRTGAHARPKPTSLSYIHLGSSVCHPVCHPVILSSCHPVIVAERWAILYV